MQIRRDLAIILVPRRTGMPPQREAGWSTDTLASNAQTSYRISKEKILNNKLVKEAENG
jgi:hypothetical protein